MRYQLTTARRCTTSHSVCAVTDEREAFQRQRQWELEQLGLDQERQALLLNQFYVRDPRSQIQGARERLANVGVGGSNLHMLRDSSLGVLSVTLAMMIVSLILLKMGFTVSLLIAYAILSLLLIVVHASIEGLRIYNQRRAVPALAREVQHDTRGRIPPLSLQELLLSMGTLQGGFQRWWTQEQVVAFDPFDLSQTIGTGSSEESPTRRAAANRIEEQRQLGESLCDVLPTYEYIYRDHGSTNAEAEASAGNQNAAARCEDEVRSASRLMCSICLESVADGTTVRILPCMHQFCASCVDPWLCHSCMCPICKEPVVV